MESAYQLRQVVFGYSAQPVIEIQDWSVARGQISALSGDNGVGKSTLFNLLAFITPCTQGEIYFMGNEVSGQRLDTYRHRVGLVQQNPYLLRGTVADNLALGLKFQRVAKIERQRRVAEVIERLDIADLQMRASHMLSGGEAQKVAIGRVLVLQPEVILLDEPFTHLDVAYRADLCALILQLCQQDGKTIIFSTHEAEHARAIADQRYTLQHGKLSLST